MWCGLTLAFPGEMDETAHFGLAHRVPTLHVTLTLMVAILSSKSKAGKNHYSGFEAKMPPNVTNRPEKFATL